MQPPHTSGQNPEVTVGAFLMPGWYGYLMTNDPNNLPVTLYSKSSCVQCTATERWLKSHDVRYVKHDVVEDATAYDYVVALGYQQVPVVVVPFDRDPDAGHWSGFNPDRLGALL